MDADLAPAPDLAPSATLRIVPTDELTPADVAALRALLWAAFAEVVDEDGADGGMTEDDWQHALGGRHVLLEVDGELVATASLVERAIEVGGRRLRTGYVEAVATAPAFQRRGHATRVMATIADLIRADFELGMLGTGELGFYERLGWRTWAGPSSVRPRDGGPPVASPDEDGYLMVITTPTTPPLDPQAPITCDWRPGDSW